jgi:hypothetical protein
LPPAEQLNHNCYFTATLTQFQPDMKTNIIWTGREYYSLENCIVTINNDSTLVHSAIVGRYHEKMYDVNYRIVANPHWQTTSLEINFHINGSESSIRLVGDGHGNWKLNGEQSVRFNGCIDVDIPLTPFTNTLPIRRLRLAPGQSREIRVLYCDLLENDIRPVRQKYVCISDRMYHYENIPNDFEADIEVDDAGIVVDYPLLFERTAAILI